MISSSEMMEIMKDAVKLSLLFFIVKELISVDKEPSVEELRRIIREETERAIRKGMIRPPEQTI